MALSHNFIINFQNDGGAIQNFTANQTSDGALSASVVIPPSSSNFQIVFPLTASLVKSVILWTDATMIVLTKSGGSTVNTFNMVANKPLIWQFGFPVSCPITGDCSHLHVTSTPGGNLKAYVLEDI